MDFANMLKQQLASSNEVVVDAQLLPQLRSCARGLEHFDWKAVDSLSDDAAVLGGCLQQSPLAVVIDGRVPAGGPALDTLHCNVQAQDVFVVVDELCGDTADNLSKHGCDPITFEEIQSGRLALGVKQRLGRRLALTQAQLRTDEGRYMGATHPDVAHLTGSQPFAAQLLSPEVPADSEASKAANTPYKLPSANDSAESPRDRKESAAVVLNRIAVEMINRVELPALLQHIADNAGNLTSADYAYVALVHESGDYLETIAANRNFYNLKSVRHRPGEGIGGQVWLTGRTVCEPDYQYYRHRLPGLTTARQACSVPLMLGDRVIGVIGILYENYDQRIEDQVDVLEMFAPLASVAIDNASLHESNRLELARTEAISKISRAIYGSASFDSIIDGICTTLIESFDAGKAHLYRLEEDGTYLPLAAWQKVSGRIQRARQAGSELVAMSIARWCIENQQSAFIKRGVDDPRESAEVHQIRARWRLGSTICLPLVHEDRSWGILFAHRSMDRSDFTEGELKQFELIGGQISMALLRRELMEKVEHQAFHDRLTGLNNRWRFESLLVESAQQSAQSDGFFAVLSIDLNRFKVINDSYGHHVGDQVLQRVSRVLQEEVEATDVLARMDGDEFSVIANDYRSRDEIIYLAQRINDCLSRTLDLGELRVNLSVSIGICFYPQDADSADEILNYADFAMDHAKQTASVSISVFNRTLLVDHQNRSQRELDLQNALVAGEFELHYQPKVNCRSGFVDGVEALLRWNHPQLGYVPPAEFIPMAERCGLIEKIGRWVINQACVECAQLQQSHSALRVAINISARQFNVDDFVPNLFATLKKNKLSPRCLELEVTESVVMYDVGKVVEKLTQLRAGGITVAIDDFGTGYSSLQYLAELPLDVLKIDKSFIDRLDDRWESQSLVKTILMMSRELDLKTVAEGVESESQQIKLRQLGCDYIQGYYYSRPVPADELAVVIESINRQYQPRRIA
jgi:diguanylate cyclase (GGDEF)-like protein